VLIALLLTLTLDDPAALPAPTDVPVPVAQPAAADAPRGTLFVLPAQTGKATPKPKPSNALRFVWRDHPSLRAGRNFRLDFGVKIQEDGRQPDDDPDPAKFPTWQLRRARGGVDGELFRKIQFSLEREFSENFNNDPTKKSTKSQWKDVYVEANLSNALQVRAGKFKIPYGLDQTSGESNLDFVYRSLGGDYLSPGRDIGGMVHGRFFKRGLNYWVGGFQHDGENSRSGNPQPELRKTRGADQTFAGRVTAAIFRKAGLAFLQDGDVGGSFATSTLPDNGFTPNGLRGRTVVSQHTFFEGVFVKGTRRRYGVDIDVPHGPFGARAEYMFVADRRDKQGLGDENLSNVRGKAWYVLGSWVATGEKKARPVEARNGGVGRGGYGALELTARFDTLRFDSKIGQDPPFRNSRAETVFPNADRVFTGGFTYYANRWVKIQGNAIHEAIDDLERSPTLTGTFWSTVLRLQFEL
jgi:phosphate-selective porin OprO/OprP